jgi:hypothetical protein
VSSFPTSPHSSHLLIPHILHHRTHTHSLFSSLNVSCLSFISIVVIATGFMRLVRAMNGNTSLKVLNAEGDEIGDYGCMDFVNSLLMGSTCCNLREISLAKVRVCFV